MRTHRLLIGLGMVVCFALVLALVCGCGGGGETGSMMLKITDPADGSTCTGNAMITCTMLNPAMASSVLFKANGVTFATITEPDLTMTARLDTLSLGLSNGPVIVTIETTGNVYTTSRTLNVSNVRSIFVQDVSGDAGDYVTVHVRLNDFATAAGYHVVLNYDSARLWLNAGSVAKGAGVPALSDFTPNTAQSGVLEATVTGTNTFTGNELLTACFQIRHPSDPGDMADITVDSATLSNSSGGALTVARVDGSVTTN